MEVKRTTSFIKRIDQYLLKNYPVTWSTRIHTAGLYGLGFAILVAIISLIVPNDPRNETTIHYWIVLISITSLLGFVFWMIYLLRFNVFKRYGTWKVTDTIKTFIFYFIIIAIILSWPFIPPILESARANAAYSTKELVADINAMNIKLCQLEQDSIDTRFRKDTFQIDNSVIGIQMRPPMGDFVDAPENDHYFLIDTARLREKLETADSLKKITDSIYVIYTCPRYQFIYDHLGWQYDDEDDPDSRLELLSSMDLYRQVLQNKQVIDKEKTRSELGQLFAKYSTDHDPKTLRANTQTYHSYGESDHIARIKDRYDLYLLNQQINHITDKKFRWDEGAIQISSRLVYYFGLCLAMLVLVYRHTTRRTFFLSLLSAVVLSIITGLFIAMSPDNANAFFIWTIFYFILFIALAAFIFNSKYRNVVSGIALNLLVFMTPFMPLVITSYYYESLHDRYSHSEYREYAHLFENQRLHMFLSEIGGGVLLILLLATLYQMAYKKWFALPEQ